MYNVGDFVDLTYLNETRSPFSATVTTSLDTEYEVGTRVCFISVAI